MDIGTLLLLVGFAYAIGVFWYDLLPGRVAMKPWRVAAYPFAAMVIAETLLPRGPVFGGVHILTAIIAALIGVIIDWIVTETRRPKAVEAPEATVPSPTRT